MSVGLLASIEVEITELSKQGTTRGEQVTAPLAAQEKQVMLYGIVANS